MQAIIKLGGAVRMVVTPKDCRVDTFRSGGKGGQNQNKVESGVRYTHEPSGAVGEARDSRDQLRNRRSAFERMTQTKEFVQWVKICLAEITGHEIEERERGTAQKGEKIRTYHEGRGTVLDHRTGRTYNYDEVLYGKGIDEVMADCRIELARTK
jgi:protein subunit release factor A